MNLTTVKLIGCGTSIICAGVIFTSILPPLQTKNAYPENSPLIKVRKSYDFFANNFAPVLLSSLTIPLYFEHKKIIHEDILAFFMVSIVALAVIPLISPASTRLYTNEEYKVVLCYSPHTNSVGTIYIPVKYQDLPQELIEAGLSIATPEQIEASKNRRKPQTLPYSTRPYTNEEYKAVLCYSPHTNSICTIYLPDNCQGLPPELIQVGLSIATPEQIMENKNRHKP